MEQEFRNKGLIWEDPLSNPNFLDIRLNEEKQIEREIYTGIKLNSDIDTSATEFVETNCIRDFISDSSNFNRNGQHLRTHEIVEQSRTDTFCNQPTSWQVLVQPMHNLECAYPEGTDLHRKLQAPYTLISAIYTRTSMCTFYKPQVLYISKYG